MPDGFTLVKDHKGWSVTSETPTPSRPVVAGNVGLSSHLSELIIHVLELITLESPGSEIDSTSDMLSRIDKLNDKISNGSIRDEIEREESITDNIIVQPIDESVANLQQNVHQMLSKGDIRSFGKIGKKTSTKFNE